MRGLAAAIALSLLTIAALAAHPQVEAALNVFQAVGTDANQLRAFCELMQIEEENAENAAPFLESKLDKLLDELGADFKAAWDTFEDIDPASETANCLMRH